MAKAGVENFQSLDPREVFTGLISKAQVVAWEKRLKKVLGHLIATDEKRFNVIRSEILKTPSRSQIRENPLTQDEDTRLLVGKYL